MSIKVQQSVIKNVKNVLKDKKYKGNMAICFGKRSRSSFRPFLSIWEQNLLRDKFPFSVVRRRINSSQHICDLGYISGYEMQLCLISDEDNERGNSDGDNCDGDNCEEYSVDESHNIRLVNGGMYLIFHKNPENIKTIFEPVKHVLSNFKPVLRKLELENNYIKLYNMLFGKSIDKPLIFPKWDHYLSEKILCELKEEKYLVSPMYKGERAILFIYKERFILFSANSQYILSEKADPSLSNTVLSGEWYDNKFSAYDIAMCQGKDIRKYSLSYRYKILIKIFPISSIVQRIEYKECNEKNICSFAKNGGVIFSPVRANFVNNRTYIFQEIEDVNFSFHIQPVSNIVTTFALFTGKDKQSFNGTTLYPYMSSIPITKSDQRFMGPITGESAFQFKWIDSNFVPCCQVNLLDVLSTRETKKRWNYINNIVLLLDVLSVFKKMI